MGWIYWTVCYFGAGLVLGLVSLWVGRSSLKDTEEDAQIVIALVWTFGVLVWPVSLLFLCLWEAVQRFGK